MHLARSGRGRDRLGADRRHSGRHRHDDRRTGALGPGHQVFGFHARLERRQPDIDARHGGAGEHHPGHGRRGSPRLRHARDPVCARTDQAGPAADAGASLCHLLGHDRISDPAGVRGGVRGMLDQRQQNLGNRYRGDAGGSGRLSDLGRVCTEPGIAADRFCDRNRYRGRHGAVRRRLCGRRLSGLWLRALESMATASGARRRAVVAGPGSDHGRDSAGAPGGLSGGRTSGPELAVGGKGARGETSGLS